MFSACRSLVAALLACAPCLADSSRVLRVAADPNNLPFTNERREGFENRIAELVADELGMRLEYMWWPQRRGFFRETVGSGRADVVMGVPARFDRLLTTKPYYHSTYVFVRREGGRAISSFDDPALGALTIGVQLAGDDGTNTPPAHALTRRGYVGNIRGYTLYGDYAQDSPPSAIIRAVATGEIDIAVAWGPMAGYFARRQKEPLRIVPVQPCDCPELQFVFAIAVGVTREKPELRESIDRILARRASDVARILSEYDVPLASAPGAASSHAREP